MHPAHFSILALELARERVREAEAYHRYHDALDLPSGPGVARRSVARVAATVSRASAALARRLDGAAFDTDHFRSRSTPA